MLAEIFRRGLNRPPVRRNAHAATAGRSGRPAAPRILGFSSDPFSASGDAPDWLDKNGDAQVNGQGEVAGWTPAGEQEHAYPTSFTGSSGAPGSPLGAVWHIVVEGNPLPGTKIVGQLTGAFMAGAQFETALEIVPDAANPTLKHLTGNGQANETLPATIDKNLLSVNWSFKKPKGVAAEQTQTFGTSINPVYVTGASRLSEFHTVVDIACRNAKGLQPTSDNQKRQIVDAIWGDFANPMPGVMNVAEQELTYWGTEGGACFAFDEFIRTRDGRCGAWAELLVRALSVAAATPASVATVVQDPEHYPPGQFVNYGTPPFACTYQGFRVIGTLPGQGGIPAVTDFSDHAVVLVPATGNGPLGLLDPSYGTRFSGSTPLEALHTWENAALVGIRAVDGGGTVRAVVKTPNVPMTTFFGLTP